MAVLRSGDNALTSHDKHKIRGTCKCVVIWEQNLKPAELISATKATLPTLSLLSGSMA